MKRNTRRLLANAIVIHRRSRHIFFWYALAGMVSSGLLWWKLEALGVAAGVTQNFSVLKPFYRTVVVLLAALLATAGTAGGLIGPVHRIEEWLANRGDGWTRALRVRSRDPFATLIRLLNEMHWRQNPQDAGRVTHQQLASPQAPPDSRQSAS